MRISTFKNELQKTQDVLASNVAKDLERQQTFLDKMRAGGSMGGRGEGRAEGFVKWDGMGKQHQVLLDKMRAGGSMGKGVEWKRAGQCQHKGRMCVGPCEQRALDAHGLCVAIVPLTCCPVGSHLPHQRQSTRLTSWFQVSGWT